MKNEKLGATLLIELQMCLLHYHASQMDVNRSGEIHYERKGFMMACELTKTTNIHKQRDTLFFNLSWYVCIERN